MDNNVKRWRKENHDRIRIIISSFKALAFVNEKVIMEL